MSNFVKELLKDQQAREIVKAIKEHAEKYGEDHDEFLSYIIGAVSRIYEDPRNLIVVLESLKLIFIHLITDHGINLVQDEITEENVKPI